MAKFWMAESVIQLVNSRIGGTLCCVAAAVDLVLCSYSILFEINIALRRKCEYLCHINYQTQPFLSAVQSLE